MQKKKKKRVIKNMKNLKLGQESRSSFSLQNATPCQGEELLLSLLDRFQSEYFSIKYAFAGTDA